jgi:hypothetical protein
LRRPQPSCRLWSDGPDLDTRQVSYVFSKPFEPMKKMFDAIDAGENEPIVARYMVYRVVQRGVTRRRLYFYRGKFEHFAA